MTRAIVIAIDGPAASGKGTLAKRIAVAFGFAHLDTGALYRAVGVAVMRQGLSPDDPHAATEAAKALDLDLIDDPSIRSAEAGQAASRVSAFPGVRQALLGLQRRFAAQPPGGLKGAVLDGRDIGSVICPDADIKLYVTASAQIRARRRAAEIRQQNPQSFVDERQILAEIQARDSRDMGRAAAPLIQTSDAILLDTSDLDIEAAAARAIALVANALRIRPA